MADNLPLALAWTVAWLALYVWTAASLSAVFRKAGEEGWQAWVPVLNIVVLLRLGGLSGWWALLLLLPVAGTLAVAVLVWIACSRINTAFGVGIGMTVLAVLLFPVWSSVLGWGSARWLGREQRAPGPLRSRSGSAPAATPVPASASPTYGGLPLDSIPPRPTSFPAAPPVASPAIRPVPAAPPVASPPTRPVPAATAGRDSDEDIGYPRREVPAGSRRAVAAETDQSESEQAGQMRDAETSRTPATATPSNGHDPWAPPEFSLPVRTPRYSPVPGDGGFSDTSAAVSAVVGAPSLGAPMSARSSVSALNEEPELPDAESAFDETIIATRRRTPWMLHTPLGAPIAVSSDVLIIGRRPSSDPDYAHAQLVPVADETRTMSKTHARLHLTADGWSITDLDSTNGVVLISPDGAETELVPNQPEPVTETFLLGDAELRLARSSGSE